MNRRSISCWRALLACAAAALTAWGCGGGVGLEGTGGGVGLEGTGSAVTLSSGPITGFGSIVVNGVRFNIDGQNLRLDDLSGGGRGKDDLRLGMVVEVQAAAIGSSGGTRRADATEVRLGSELLGPADSVGANTLVVLGQTVRVTDATVFDDAYPNGLASVAADARAVEVFGFHDPLAGQIVATRLQPRSGSLVLFRLRGPVSALNTTERSFQVHGQRFSYAGLATPSGLANGVYVRLTLEVVKNAQGQWQVKSFEGGGASRREAEACEFKGLVTAIDPAVAGLFSVNGTPVDARGSVLPAGLALGVRVEVQGSLRNGVLVASEVRLENEEDARGLEFEGVVGSVNPAEGSFRLVGQTVDISTTRSDLVLQPAGASLAGLVPGARVEVRALLGSDRRRAEATLIEFED